MNAELSATRKEYWAKVHAIQRDQNVDAATAKKLYKSNGHAAPKLKTMSIDDIAALAESKVAEIHNQLEALSKQIGALQIDLARWGRVRELSRPEAVMAQR